MLTKEAREAVADYFAELADVDAAFLFGSQARGTAKSGSDVDVAVLLKHGAPKDVLRPVTYTNDLMDILNRSDVDVVILNRAPPVLVHRVARDGHVLYATSNTVVAEFGIRALQQLEDTRPLRDLQASQTRQIFQVAAEKEA